MRNTQVDGKPLLKMFRIKLFVQIAPSQEWDSMAQLMLNPISRDWKRNDLFISWMVKRMIWWSWTNNEGSLQNLEASGVPDDILDDLVELHSSAVDENIIVIVFLYLLSQQKQFKKEM